MNKKLGVSFDFDDVLYNLTKINLLFIKNEYGIKLDPLKIDRFSYYIDEGYGKIIDGVWNNEEVYLSSSLYDGAKELYLAVVDLVGIENVQIVTTSLPNIIEKKNHMIKNIFGLDCRVIHSKEKHLYTKDTIMIDDSIANIVSHVHNNNNPAIIVDLGYGWNKSLKENNKTIFRANSFNEILNIIKNIIDLSEV